MVSSAPHGSVPSGSEPGPLRIGYVPGVIVSRWQQRWIERFPGSPLTLTAVPQAEQDIALRDGRVDMCFVRLPIDRDGMHAIPLYREQAVVVVPEDHPVALFDEVASADLTGERMQDGTDIDALAETVQLVAALGGAAIMPQSLARLHHRRDLVYRNVIDAPDTGIALAWPIADERPAPAEFIGIVRGRTANSSRSEVKTPEPPRKSAAGRQPVKRATPPGKRTPARRRGR